MVLNILDSGQVLKYDRTDTYEQWLPIGMETEAEITVDKINARVNEEINVTLKWTKINLEKEVWEYDPTNQDAFNLVVGTQMYQVPADPGTKVLTFSAPGTYVIGVRNFGKGSQDVVVTITQ